MTEQERIHIQNTLYFLGRAYRSSQENIVMEGLQRWLEAKLQEPLQEKAEPLQEKADG